MRRGALEALGNWQVVWCLAFFCIVFALPVFNFISVLSWHDQQRVGQIVLIFLSVVHFFVGRKFERLDWGAEILLLGILGLGIVSCVLADRPLWAFTELALFVGSYFVVCAVRDFRVLDGRRFDILLWWLLVLVVGGIVLKFLVSYFSAIVLKGPVDSLLLFDGFSWPRFLGQFQTLGLPLIIWPALARKRRGSGWSVLLCVVWWFATLAAGTRASWLGMACAILVMPFLFKSGKKFSVLQGFCFLAGLVLYKVLMDVVPWALELPIGNLAEDRLSFSMSGREMLWATAWGMFLEHPWLGVGPMHFAEIAHPLGAHPHQAILQWISEWGGVSALLVIFLIGRSAWIFYKGARGSQAEDSSLAAIRICLMGSFIASAAHAMFDGSLVMPYTQLWLAILIGWAWGLHSEQYVDAQRSAMPFQAMVSALASLLLIFVAVRDIPQIMVEDNRTQVEEICWREAPRFWYNGIIKEKPQNGCEVANQGE